MVCFSFICVFWIPRHDELWKKLNAFPQFYRKKYFSYKVTEKLLIKLIRRWSFWVRVLSLLIDILSCLQGS